MTPTGEDIFPGDGDVLGYTCEHCGHNKIKGG
jgi:hypothetical protein